MSYWNTDCCRPSRLAEFVNGKGSLERWREECCRRQNGGTGACCLQGPTTSIPCCDDTSPERVIKVIMPIRLPRPCTPCPKNRLASIDILEEMLPAVRDGCCSYPSCEVTSNPCCDVTCDPCCDVTPDVCFDPCCNKVTRKHRITIQDHCDPPCFKVTKWPNLGLPKKSKRGSINPCPPPPSDEEDEDEDENDEGWKDKDTGTYFFNKKTGRFEPCPKPRCIQPRITIVKAPPSCPPPPQQIPVPWPIPPCFPGCGCPFPSPWNSYSPFSGLAAFGGFPGAPQCYIQPPPMCCAPLEEIGRRRRKHRRGHRSRKEKVQSGHEQAENKKRKKDDDEEESQENSGSTSGSSSSKSGESKTKDEECDEDEEC